MNEDFIRARDYLLRVVNEAPAPVSPSRLLAREHREGNSPTQIRRALWHLVTIGELVLTREIHVAPAAWEG